MFAIWGIRPERHIPITAMPRKASRASALGGLEGIGWVNVRFSEKDRRMVADN